MWRRWAIGIIVTIAASLGIGLFYLQSQDNNSTVVLGDRSFQVSIMRTNEELQRGLSGTSNLPSGQAMLFVFPPGASASIWMKDMNYAIDIVWLNGKGGVVHVEKNVDPSSYDAENPETSKIYMPSVPARYVIELPSGTIEETGIGLGDLVELPSGI